MVGSYLVPDWLATLPSEQAPLDATSVVFKIQESALTGPHGLTRTLLDRH